MHGLGALRLGRSNYDVFAQQFGDYAPPGFAGPVQRSSESGNPARDKHSCARSEHGENLPSTAKYAPRTTLGGRGTRMPGTLWWRFTDLGNARSGKYSRETERTTAVKRSRYNSSIKR